MNRKLVTFTIALTAQLFLFGQEPQKELRTYRQGIDNAGFSVYEVERIPDTVWFEVADPVTIMMNIAFEFDREETDTDHCVRGHVSRLSDAYVDNETQLHTQYTFLYLSPSEWMLYYYNGADSLHTDILELKPLDDSLLNMMAKRFIGRPCKVCSPKYNRHKGASIRLKRYQRRDAFDFFWQFCVLPKEKKVDLK